MKYRRKKGSALIIMIVTTMILTIISGVMAMSILNTTKLNAHTKNDNDLFYAAESGLEYAQAYFAKNSDKMDDILWVGKTVEEDLSSYYSNIGNVKVTYKRESEDQITVTSEAVDDNGKKKKISCTYNASVGAPRGGYMYEYSTMSNELEIVVSGAYTTAESLHKPNPIDFKTTRLGYVESRNIEVWNGVTGELIPESEYNDRLERPELNAFKVNSSLPTDFEGIKFKEEIVVSATDRSIALALDKEIDNGYIVKESLILPHRKEGQIGDIATPGRLDIYFVNADKLYLEGTTAGIELNNAMIICKGDVIVSDFMNKVPVYESIGLKKSIFSDMPMKFNKSSIIAKNVRTYSGNFHCTYSVMMNTANSDENENGLVWPGTGDIKIVEDTIKKYIKGWSPFTGEAIENPGSGPMEDENYPQNDGINTSEWKLDQSSISYE